MRRGKSAAFKADKEMAKAAEIKFKNNPFEIDSRPYRMFNKLRVHSDQMDARFRDLEEVYGTIGQRRKQIDNTPNVGLPSQ